jgi:mono/diheme cytochrome c family protein
MSTQTATARALNSDNAPELLSPYRLGDLTLANRMVMAPMTRSRALANAVPNPIAADEASIARGQAIYTKACASCHGPEGKGDGKSAKILAKKPADLNLHAPHHTDGDLFWKITEGKKPMPAFKKDLKENQRWDVVNYLRQLTGPAEAKGDSAKKAAKEAKAPQEPPQVIPESTGQSPTPEGRGGY